MPSLSSIAQGYALPVGAGIVGGILNNNAAGNATQALTQGANQAIGTVSHGSQNAQNTLSTVYGQQQGMLAPYAAAGGPALSTLQTGTAPGGDFVKPFDAATFDLYKDPGFNWRVQQGQRAINQGANAGGIRFSGATLKALDQFNQDSASQEYAAARARAEEDQTKAYQRTMDQANLGLNATNKTVDAGGTYGTNVANLQLGTAKSIADLQTDLASAKAAGDVAKASSITQAINGILSGVQNAGIGQTLAKLAGVGGAGATTAAATPGLTAALAAGGPAAATGAAATAIPGGAAALDASAAGAAGMGGLGATIGGLLTNPITIAAGAALGIGLLWHKSQVHQTANDWVQGTQNDFDQQMAAIDQQQMDQANKAELKKAAITDYLAAAMSFAQKGKKQAQVIGQALDTLRKWYNPQQYGVVA